MAFVRRLFRLRSDVHDARSPSPVSEPYRSPAPLNDPYEYRSPGGPTGSQLGRAATAQYDAADAPTKEV
jgi:hypothetical protein